MAGMTFPPMRPQIEIQRQHDMLMSLMQDEGLFRTVVPREFHPAIAMATDVLCWVLHHDVDSHPSSYAAEFARCLQDIQDGLREVGFVWVPPPDAEYIVKE